MSTPHAISWFEIPSEDFDRAKAFYMAIFVDTEGNHMALLSDH